MEFIFASLTEQGLLPYTKHAAHTQKAGESSSEWKIQEWPGGANSFLLLALFSHAIGLRFCTIHSSSSIRLCHLAFVLLFLSPLYPFPRQFSGESFNFPIRYNWDSYLAAGGNGDTREWREGKSFKSIAQYTSRKS